MSEQIRNIISRGESRRVEFKSQLPAGKQLAKTAIAFANSGGGRIFIGVDDRGTVIGVLEEDLLTIPDTLSNTIFDNCCPPIIPEIFIERIDDLSVIVATIYPSSTKPHHLKADGEARGCYIRVGATNKLASGEIIAELKRQSCNTGFDEEIVFSDNDFSPSIAKLCVDFFEITSRHINTNHLLSFKILQETQGKCRTTNAFHLLAGTGIIECAKIQCALFRGVTPGHFLDRKEFGGSLHTQATDAIRFVEKYLPLRSVFDTVRRIDHYAIPLVAIREVIMNAVVHRDYSISGADIKIAMFENRIEITSPGALPASLDINTMTTGRSELRNKVIARFFREIGYVEQWGTGIPKTIEACKAANIEPPHFTETGTYLKVVFSFPTKNRNYCINDNVNDNVNDRSSSIINLIKADKFVTIKALSSILRVSPITISRAIDDLKTKGMIRRVGPDKNGYWEVISNV